MKLTRSFLENIIGDKGTVEQILKNQEIVKRIENWCKKTDGIILEKCKDVNQIFNLWLRIQFQKVLEGKE